MAQTIENHFYTTSETERDNAIRNLGYLDEGIAGWAPAQADSRTIPLFRLFNAAISDHFYTTSATERDHAVQILGYASEGVACLVFRSGDDTPRSQALFRLYHRSNTDHFYTMSRDERDLAVTALGFESEGVACHLWPSRHPAAVPLYRLYVGDAQGPHADRTHAAVEA